MEKVEKVKSRWRKNYMEDINGNGSPRLHDLNNDTSNIIGHQTNHSDDSSNITHASQNSNNHHRHHHHHHHKPPEFDEIAENIYLEKRCRREPRSIACECVLSRKQKASGMKGCADDCLNRMLMIECGSSCKLGLDYCLNRRFQLQESAPVEIFKTRKKGYGLRAKTELPPNTFIMEYVGEVVRSKEFRKRVKKYHKLKIKHHYFMALRNDEIIDGTMKGNKTRFINHSCEPNCETQKWTVNGDIRVGFFSLRTIRESEEITFDYQFQRYGRKAQKCYCEAPSCRGFIGGSEQTYSLTNGNENENESSPISKGSPDFKIPKLSRLQRMVEIDKKITMDRKIESELERKIESELGRKIEKVEKSPFSLKTNINNANTNTSSAIKRSYDSMQFTNNIDLTPAPKISKEEHRQRFEMQVKLKEFYNNYINAVNSQQQQLDAQISHFPPSVLPPILAANSFHPPHLLYGTTSNLPSETTGRQQHHLNSQQHPLSRPSPAPTPNILSTQFPHLVPQAPPPILPANSFQPPHLLYNSPSNLTFSPLGRPTSNQYHNHLQVPPPRTTTYTSQIERHSYLIDINHDVVKPEPTNLPTLIVLTEPSDESKTFMNDDLAATICDYDEYYTKRDQPVSLDIVMDEIYPYPGTYYTTPSGENWFATVTLNRKTQRPQTVMLNLKPRN